MDKRARRDKEILVHHPAGRAHIPAHAILGSIDVSTMPGGDWRSRDPAHFLQTLPHGAAEALRGWAADIRQEADNLHGGTSPPPRAEGCIRTSWSREEVVRRPLMHAPEATPATVYGGRSTATSEAVATRWAKAGYRQVGDLIHDTGARILTYAEVRCQHPKLPEREYDDIVRAWPAEWLKAIAKPRDMELANGAWVTMRGTDVYGKVRTFEGKRSGKRTEVQIYEMHEERRTLTETTQVVRVTPADMAAWKPAGVRPTRIQVPKGTKADAVHGAQMELRAAVGEREGWCVVHEDAAHVHPPTHTFGVAAPHTLTTRQPISIAHMSVAKAYRIEVSKRFTIPRAFDPKSIDQHYGELYAHLTPREMRGRMRVLARGAWDPVLTQPMQECRHKTLVSGHDTCPRSAQPQRRYVCKRCAAQGLDRANTLEHVIHECPEPLHARVLAEWEEYTGEHWESSDRRITMLGDRARRVADTDETVQGLYDAPWKVLHAALQLVIIREHNRLQHATGAQATPRTWDQLLHMVKLTMRSAAIGAWTRPHDAAGRAAAHGRWVVPGFLKLKGHKVSMPFLAGARVADDSHTPAGVEVHIHTDGAGPTRTVEASGWGAVTRHQRTSGETEVVYAKGHLTLTADGTPHTNNTAEMTAMRMKLREAVLYLREGKSVVIASDSAYAIRAATGNIRIKKKGKNKEEVRGLRSAYTAALRSATVPSALQMRKVKGHSDNVWNDVADELAGAGRDQAQAPTYATRRKVEEHLGSVHQEAAADATAAGVTAVHTRDGAREEIAAMMETLTGQRAGRTEVYIAELHTAQTWRRTGKAAKLLAHAAHAAGPGGYVRLTCVKYRCRHCVGTNTCDECGHKHTTRTPLRPSAEYEYYTATMGFTQLSAHRQRGEFHEVHSSLRAHKEAVGDTVHVQRTVQLVVQSDVLRERARRALSGNKVTTRVEDHEAQHAKQGARSADYTRRTMWRQSVDMVAAHLATMGDTGDASERIAQPTEGNPMWQGYANAMHVIWRTRRQPPTPTEPAPAPTAAAVMTHASHTTRDATRTPPPPPPLPDRAVGTAQTRHEHAVAAARRAPYVSAVQCTVIDAILRATDAFGVLAEPVVLLRTATANRVDALAAAARADIAAAAHTTTPERTASATARVEAAHRQMTDMVWQAAARRRKIDAGTPVVCQLHCEIDVRAIRDLLQRGVADTIARHGDGTTYGGLTYRQIAEDFLTRTHTRPDGTHWVTIRYSHSAKGHMYKEAGIIQDSRVYANDSKSDPFRLPKLLRGAALRGRFDMDDSASFPRAAMHMIPHGRHRAREFLAHRKQILKCIGAHFLPMEGEQAQYEAAKQLTNLLDMDGTMQGWCDQHRVPTTRTVRGLKVGMQCTGCARSLWHAGHCAVYACGERFDLAAYIAEQPARTAWLEKEMPRAMRFTKDMHAAMHSRKIPARTLKSYCLQEAEAHSRTVKMRWAQACGHAAHNIQHDGVVIDLAPGTTAAEAERMLTEVCTASLGYEQPVEHKPHAAPA